MWCVLINWKPFTFLRHILLHNFQETTPTLVLFYNSIVARIFPVMENPVQIPLIFMVTLLFRYIQIKTWKFTVVIFILRNYFHYKYKNRNSGVWFWNVPLNCSFFLTSHPDKLKFKFSHSGIFYTNQIHFQWLDFL